MTITIRFLQRLYSGLYADRHHAIHISRDASIAAQRRIVARELRQLRHDGLRVARVLSWYPLY